MMFTLSIGSVFSNGSGYVTAANKAMNTAMQRLSTGYRINSAADDPVGYIVASGFNSKIRGLKTAYQNTQDGYTMLNLADGALSDINSLLDRVRELGLMGANSIQTKEQRNALQKEANELVDEIYRIINYTTYGDDQILGKAAETLSVLSNTISPPPILKKHGKQLITAHSGIVYGSIIYNTCRNNINIITCRTGVFRCRIYTGNPTI